MKKKKIKDTEGSIIAHLKIIFFLNIASLIKKVANFTEKTPTKKKLNG